MLLSFWFSILNINVYKLFDGQIKYWHKLQVRFKAASIGWAWAMCTNIVNTRLVKYTCIDGIFKSVRSRFWSRFFSALHMHHLFLSHIFLFVSFVCCSFCLLCSSPDSMSLGCIALCIISYRYLYHGRSAESVHCDLCISISLWVQNTRRKLVTNGDIQVFFFMWHNITMMILSLVQPSIQPRKMLSIILFIVLSPNVKCSFATIKYILDICYSPKP